MSFTLRVYTGVFLQLGFNYTYGSRFRKTNDRIKLQTLLKSSALVRSLRLLKKIDRRKIVLISIIQVGMSFLDLAGVLAIGLLGSITLSSVQSNNPIPEVLQILEVLNIDESSFETQALLLGIISIFLLVGRTILSMYFTRRILYFLSRRGAVISANLVSRLLAQPLLSLQAKSTEETLFSITRGVEYITVNVLAISVVAVADISLVIVLGVGLFLVDMVTAIGTTLIFSIIGLMMYRMMHFRVGALGLTATKINIESNEKIVEVFSSYRESVVRNRRDYYARKIGKLRYSLANIMAEIYFMPYISKYVIESAVVLGALSLAAFQFIVHDATQAVVTLSIFMVAGTRIAPAVLRVQQGLIQIRSGLGMASSTLDLIESLGNMPLIEDFNDKVDAIHKGFTSEIDIEDVSLTYPNKIVPAIANVSLSIPAGTSIAFVGLSGAGKTTLIDILLGVLIPDKGSVLVSGLPPLLAVAKWPGAISYVPQDVVIAAGTIRENVALGYPIEEATDELVMGALNVAHLDDFVASLPDGIDTQVGERGARISGGQRQRLGIARAMFTHPHLLVLDEATSSLDGETEARISDAIHALKGSTTVVIIAHRLSTVRNADKVVYLSNGKVIAAGTFEEVRNTVPDFDRQANIMGL